jgi:L-histidine N-alpha-methyltransferase
MYQNDAVAAGLGALALRTMTPSRIMPDIADDASRGLLEKPRAFPSKYFYDDRGSVLFDKICDTPEYYPTRTEDALLARYSNSIVERARPQTIIELGSGTSRKTRRLLDACGDLAITPSYRPIDVCEEVLVDTGRRLIEDYEWLEIEACVGDYMAGLDDLGGPRDKQLFVFLGGTLGNLSEGEAIGLLHELRDSMQDGDYLLLGVDRVKDPKLLHAAYNDSQGLTARFNLNVLNVINRELDADFEQDCFNHYACYVPDKARVEMYLVARQRQGVALNRLGESIELAEGEAILTEISRKYTPDTVSHLLNRAGLRIAEHYQSEHPRFSLILASLG